MPFASSERLLPKKLRKKAKPEERLTVGQYLLRELGHASIDTIFGTPAKELTRLIQLMKAQDFVTTTKAGEMASGFAKVEQAGAFMCTRPLLEKEAHLILRASYEHTPLITIVGTKEELSCDETIEEKLRFVQETEELENIFHKLLRSFFIATFILDDRATAAKKIDRAIDIARHYQKPVCIEVPEEVVNAVIPKHIRRATHFFHSDPESLRDACNHILKALSGAKKPAICIGSLPQRVHGASFITQIAERFRLPIYTTASGRGVIDERHPAFRGVFSEKQLESNDLILFLGVEAKEIPLDTRHIFCLQEEVILFNERFPHIYLYDCLEQLSVAKAGTSGRRKELAFPPAIPFTIKSGANLKKERVIQLLDHFFSPNFILATRHIPPSVLLSEGSVLYSTLDAVAVGVGALFVKEERRVVILCSSDEYEESIGALKIALENDLKPIVLLFGASLLPPLGKSKRVKTEQELFAALTAAFSAPEFTTIVL